MDRGSMTDLDHPRYLIRFSSCSIRGPLEGSSVVLDMRLIVLVSVLIVIFLSKKELHLSLWVPKTT